MLRLGLVVVSRRVVGRQISNMFNISPTLPNFCLFVIMACHNNLRLVCCTYMACPDIFPSSHGNKHPNPKSSQNQDPD